MPDPASMRSGARAFWRDYFHPPPLAVTNPQSPEALRLSALSSQAVEGKTRALMAEIAALLAKVRQYAKPVNPLKEGEILTILPSGKRGVWRTIGGRAIPIEVEKGESIPDAVRRQQGKGGLVSENPSVGERLSPAVSRRLSTGIETPEQFTATAETAWIVRDDGEVVFTGRGEKDYVYIGPETRPLLKDAVFTHNHPGGGTFSREDLLFAAWGNVRQLRAFGTTPEGVRVTHTLDRPPGGWPAPAKLTAVHVRETARATQLWAKHVASGKTGSAEGFAKMREAVWTALGERYGIRYGRSVS